MCKLDEGIFSTSRNAFWIGSYWGCNSSAWRRCSIDSWKWPYALKISPKVKYWRHALRSGGWTSNELKKNTLGNKLSWVIWDSLYVVNIYRRVKWMASSKYCRLNSTRARFSKTSGFDGDIARARRKQSIDFFASPLMRQKLPIWLYSCTERGFSRLAFFSRFSNKSMLKFFKFLLCLFLRNW